EGEGRIDDGFSGILAATAPEIAMDGCRIGGATLYGTLATMDGVPEFGGPLRFRSLDCAGVKLAAGSAEIEARSDAALANVSGTAGLRLGRAEAGQYAANGIGGRVRASLRGDVLALEHTLALRGAASPYATAALVTLNGALRSDAGFERLDWRGDVEGNGLRLGAESDAAIAALGRSGAGTLVDPIAQRIAAILRRESRGSSFAADVTARHGAGGTTLVMPRGELRGGSGTRLASFSRVEARLREDAPPLLAGNIALGGAGLPAISGRMERSGGGETVFRLAMRRYEAGGSALEIPRLTLAQANDGALSFTGEAIASGPLPGGSARALRLPIDGRWSPGGALVLWPDCTEIAFDSLTLANLTLERRRLTLCPPPGGAIVRTGPAGLRIAAGAPALDLAGRLGETPVRLVSGPVGFAYPGVLTARQLDVTLGPVATGVRFVVEGLDARFGARFGEDIAGSFADADVTLASVPLDIGGAVGNWRYDGGRLELADGSFTLTDRADPDRFEPLVARDATLALENNLITAFADLRNPASDRIVT
ncbi:MAG: exoprotein, partial [Erythrobacter sp.]|nr:exoprotein [Erythrobacter sp.]